MDIYDTNILKRNISRITKERNITQSELAAAIGMQQPAISKILSCNDSSCFSIQQLVSIANYLHESIDTLLGITPIAEPQKETSLSDLCQKLFEIDKVQNVEIGICETGEYKIIDDTNGEHAPITTECMFFKNEQISQILKEWKEVESHGSLSKQTKRKIVQLWKDDTINITKTRMKKWEFRNIEEQGAYLAKILLDYYYDPVPDRFLPLELVQDDSVDVLQKFINESAFLYFDARECYDLERALNMHFSIKNDDEPESEEELLPFEQCEE